ncbi:MAG: DUF5067 domain-containing protein [Coriobacteriaceae bacterium]|jgi:hypothetical protein|nr:DUF5067 domain-containing protein [Coriobacteriaceae bacterium]
MKKTVIIVGALVLALGLVGCSEDTSGSGMNTSASGSSDAGNTNQATAEAQFYFKDNIVVTGDVKIEITDLKVIPVGATGNEYGRKTAVAFWFNTTNISGTLTSPMVSWMAIFNAYQGDNKLDVGLLPDDAFSTSQIETIKKDETVPCAVAYYLDDEDSPVVLRATKGLLGEALGEQEFALK